MTMQDKNEKKWTVVDLINTTAKFFAGKEIENPRLNAELLLAKILDFKRVDLYVNYDRVIKSDELATYRSLVKRRIQREPLQYILGETEFMGLTFIVNSAVLIPRPETEFLVDHIVNTMKISKIPQPVILEIGTGSGCIAVSLAYHIKQGQFYATEISAEAIKVARENAAINLSESGKVAERNDKVQFFEHDLFNGWPADLPKKIDVLVSNPPYIAEGELHGLASEVVDFEPKIALSDGGDGLRFYKRIFELCKNELQVNWLFLEMSGSQSDEIIKTAEQYTFKNIQIRKDLSDINRILEIRV